MPVQWGTNPAVSQSVFLLRGAAADKPAAAPANQDYYYWENDTPGGALFQSSGSVWVQLIGGAQSDGAGGTKLPGPITVNTFDADSSHEWSDLHGSYHIVDADGTAAGSSDTLTVYQARPLANDNGGQVAAFGRFGALNGNDYYQPMIGIIDTTAATGAFLKTQGTDGVNPVTRHTFGKAGGLGVFGHTPPTVQPTGGAATAGATYTAAEQTMLQAVYNALRGSGFLS